MTANLRRDGTGSLEVRRITLHHVSKALEALGGKSPSDTAVHTARKQLQRARASLRLMREALSDATYARVNTGLRDAARPLSPVRDKKMLLDALQKLASGYQGSALAVPLRTFETVLRRSYVEARAKLVGPLALSPVRKALRQVHDGGGRWRVARRGWSVLGRGLKRVYLAGRDTFSKAHRDSSVANLHEWRKQVKYLWHQLELLAPLWPGLIGELADQAHRLAEYLGDDHDLAVLREQVATHPGAFRDGDSQGALLALIDRRRVELLDKAIILGKRLYEERPEEFASRFGQYWRDWHHGT
jgi:CHAD domain-containing protein